LHQTLDKAERETDGEKNEEKKKEQNEEKNAEDLLNQSGFKFQIIFQGTPEARTTSVSSADLNTAASKVKVKVSHVTLATIRTLGELYVRQ
jgi:hypothetical protein